MSTSKRPTRAARTKPVEAVEEVPAEVDRILTPEVRQRLDAIKDPHAAKKRYTVLRLAFAKATRVPFDDVFTADKNVCNQRVWWQKWQYDPAISEAFEACYQNALALADEETLRQEMLYARDRKRSIARYSASAPTALAAVMGDAGQRGADRINAAMKLIGLADPAATDGGGPAGLYSPVGGSDTNQTVNLNHDRIDEAIERELARLAAGGQAGAAGTAAEQAKSDLDSAAGAADAGV